MFKIQEKLKMSPQDGFSVSDCAVYISSLKINAHSVNQSVIKYGYRMTSTNIHTHIQTFKIKDRCCLDFVAVFAELVTSAAAVAVIAAFQRLFAAPPPTVAALA